MLLRFAQQRDIKEWEYSWDDGGYTRVKLFVWDREYDAPIVRVDYPGGEGNNTTYCRPTLDRRFSGSVNWGGWTGKTRAHDLIPLDARQWIEEWIRRTEWLGVDG